MNKTVNILKAGFWGCIVITAAIAAVFETGVCVPGGDCGDCEFMAVSVMELATVILLPSALCMFRSGRIRRALKGSPAALLKWGAARMCMIGLPMAVNTLLYYIYMNVSFGYMAMICLVCMIFIYPGKGRCLDEISAGE